MEFLMLSTVFEFDLEMTELSDHELDLIAAGGGTTNQGNQIGLVNVNLQDNNVAVLSAGFIQA
jgi:hypothetical protein